MNRRELIAIAGAGLFVRPSDIFAQTCDQPNAFVGDLRFVNITADGQKRRLLSEFAYRDHCGKIWAVPAGTPLDGASIPAMFWGVVGKPWEGEYVSASVIHDYQCYRRIEYPNEVHRVFYEGMRLSGVPALKAKAMYLAVKLGGPTWDWATIDANRRAADLPEYPPPPPAPPPPPPGRGWSGALPPPPPPEPITDAKLQALVEQTESADLSLDQIDRLAAANRPGYM